MSSARKEGRAQQKEDKYIEQPIQTVDGVVRIKKYVLIQSVGSGSYSKCYLVKNVDSDSTYVAKVIPKKKLEILQKQKLIYEIKIHQSLSHENVVHLDHWFEDDNNQYIFMQYCPNGNLENKLTQADGNMKEADIRRYAIQIVQAIQYIHSQNILHRDLKLCNFYLDVKNNVKLGDFGFACQLASEYDKKRETCGTPNYIAPEAISGFGYSFSSDVWAIGVILFRLKYGCCPFQGESVKKTLQNVKLCNYKFPSKPKISPELKDLIQKIFNLNYDQRLSTQDILNHIFLQDELDKEQKNVGELRQEKRGFSLSRLFSSDKSKKQKQKKGTETQNTNQQKNRQGMMDRESRNQVSSSQKKEQPKRSNSCETFKEIKQIFKNKSKQNLPTAGNVLAKKESLTSPYYTLSTVVCTNRQKDQASSKTNRASIMEYSYSVSFNQTIDVNNNISKKEDNSRSNRLNQFIKSQLNSASLKQQLKLNKTNNSRVSVKISNNTQNTAFKTQKQTQEGQHQKNLQNIGIASKNNMKIGSGTGTNFINAQKIVKTSSSHSQQQLFNYCRKYFLPLTIQQEKDFTIIHYRPTLKQVIYLNTGYILHRGMNNIYKMTGQQISIQQLPKVFKYVIENKIEVKEFQNSEDFEYAQNDIMKILSYVAHSWITLKQGVILRYGAHSILTVAKLFTQEGFYICEQNGQPLMYSVDSEQVPKLLQGVVVMRIYGGWVKANSKK